MKTPLNYRVFFNIISCIYYTPVTISKYYEDGGGGGATHVERTVLHHDGLCVLGVCCVPVPPEAHVYFARNAVASAKILL